MIPTPLNSPRALLAALLFGLLLATVMALAPGVAGNRLVWFGVNVLIIEWIIVVTLGLLSLLERFQSRTRTRPRYLTGIVSLLVGTWFALAIFWTLLGNQFLESGEPTWLLIGRYTFLALLLGLTGAALFDGYRRQQLMAIEVANAQLQALRARIKPHFLFNTLNSAVSLTRTDPDGTEALLLDLSDLFRIALSDAPTIGLDEEIALCQRYIAIEKARFGDRLQVHWDLPLPVPTAIVPPLCLQPLIENAVHHGVERSSLQTAITVNITTSAEQRLVISVRNPVSTPEQESPRQGHGVGLEAVRARLATFNPEASLEAEAQDGHYIARLQIPLLPQVTTR